MFVKDWSSASVANVVAQMGLLHVMESVWMSKTIAGIVVLAVSSVRVASIVPLVFVSPLVQSKRTSCALVVVLIYKRILHTVGSVDRHACQDNVVKQVHVGVHKVWTVDGSVPS